MRLYSVCGDIFFKSSYITIKESVEEAVEKGVCLNYINLRQANLKNAQLDMAKMSGACFWGADLTNANMGDGCFKSADFRTAILKDTCMSESDCENVNFHGAYFSKTILDGTNLTRAQFSCPSLFECNLNFVKSLSHATYHHKGEVICSLNKAPIKIQGLEKPIIIMDDILLIGQDHFQKTPFAEQQKAIVSDICKRLIQS